MLHDAEMRRLAVLLLVHACARPPAAPPAELPDPAFVVADPPRPLGIPGRKPGPAVFYLANAGVVLSHDFHRVVIDGLHRPYEPEYASLEPLDRRRIEHAEGDFQTIELVLVSHVHADHFDPEAVVAHLGSNPDARLVSSPQVVEAVEQRLRPDSSAHAQIEAVTYAPGESHTRQVGTITVELIGLPHGSERFRDVQHLAHIVTFPGETALHLGDTELDEPALARLDLPARKLDAAFAPYWFFLGEGGVEAVRARIGAQLYYAIHVPPGEPELHAQLAQLAPDVVPLVDTMRDAPWPDLPDPQP